RFQVSRSRSRTGSASTGIELRSGFASVHEVECPDAAVGEPPPVDDPGSRRQDEGEEFSGAWCFHGSPDDLYRRRLSPGFGGFHAAGSLSRPAKRTLPWQFGLRLRRKSETQTPPEEVFGNQMGTPVPVEDAADLPAGYEAVKELLDDRNSNAPQRFIYGTSIEALIRNRLNKLWLLNYSHPDTTM